MSRLLIHDIGVEARAAVVGRPLRSALTSLGIALGVTALTAMIGMSTSAAASISSQFDQLQATRVEISGPENVGAFESSIGEHGMERAAGLNGVIAAGAVATSGDALVRLGSTASGDTFEVPLVATMGADLSAERVRVIAGRSYDEGNAARGDRMVLIGSIAAHQAGIGDDRLPSQVTINGERFLLAGIVDTDDDASLVPSSLVMPLSSAKRAGLGALLKAPVVVIRTRIGAAEQVGREAPLALLPTSPQQLSAAVPPRPVTLQRAVEGQTRLQLIALAIVSIVIGAVGVSNTTLVGVMERRQEIGVRRAVGASAWAIVMQFLIESSVLGFLGGVVGSVAGTVITMVVSIVNAWNLVVPAWLVPLGPALGLVVGLVAGSYPAYRASRIEPIEALRA